MEIGKKIAFLRKQQNFTQEQLAKEVGVSVPAVSKWETGAAMPDISLLMPIARALHTDINDLFSFRKNISRQEVDDFMAKLHEICMKQGYQAGMEQAFELQKEYPNDNYLKLKTANSVIMYAFTVKIQESGCEQQNSSEGRSNKKENTLEKNKKAEGMTKENEASEDTGKEEEDEEKIFQNYLEQSTRLLEEVYQDEKLYDNFGYRQAAAISLSARYIQEEKLQEAEQILKDLPPEGANTSHLLARIYLKQGKTEDTRLCLNQAKVRDLINLLADIRILFDASIREGNLTEALSLAKEYYQVRKAMPILSFVHPSELLTEVYLHMDDMEQAAEHYVHLMDEMIETIEASWEKPGVLPSGFSLYQVTAENPLYHPLLEHPVCKKKLEELKRKERKKSERI